MRRLAFAAIAVAAACALSVLALEVALRVVKRHVPFQPDPQFIRSLRPNVREPHTSYDTDDLLNGRASGLPATPVSLGVAPTNAQGLRMTENVGPKQPDEGRILLFGDSFVEGLGVRIEDRFGDVLNRRLRTLESRRAWRVINGGIQNGSPSQYVLQAARFLPEFQPDIVVLFLAPNDVNDDMRFLRDVGFVYDADDFPIAPQATRRLWWLQKSYLLRYVSVAADKWGYFKVLMPVARADITPPDFFPFLCGSDATQQAMFRETTGRYIERVKALSEAAGARFVVHLTLYRFTDPTEPPIEPKYSEERMKRKQYRCDETGGREYDAFVEGFLRERGIAYSNPHAAFLEAKVDNPHQRLWLVWDYHYSPAGHRIVADDLLTMLQPMLH